MKTSKQILPGIKFIGWLDSRHLQRRVDLMGVCGMPLPILTDIHPIMFFNDPECTCQTTKEGPGYTDTASLNFLTDERLPMERDIAFVVTDVNDKSYLIGSREHPQPIVNGTRNTGVPSDSPAGYSYEITHTAIKTLIPCLV